MVKKWKQWQIFSSWTPKLPWICTWSHKIKILLLGRKVMTKLDNLLKSRDITLTTKVYLVSSQGYGFSSSHEWMWQLDHKEGWVPKNWCFQIMTLKKTLESPLDCKEIQPINPKGNQPWICIGRTDAEAGAPILCLLDNAFSLFLTYSNFPCFPASFVIVKYILISILGILWQDIFSR